MQAVISVASVLACAFSLDAQIGTTLNPLPDGTTRVTLRNNSAVSLAAFAISVKYATRTSPTNDPLTVYVDSEVDAFPAIGLGLKEKPRGPLLPNQEFVWSPADGVPWNPKGGRAVLLPEQPIVAGIFADGTTTGDAALLTRMMLRRSNMLLAVETTLETLTDAGRRNIPRDRLIEQFKKLADSVRRWYLPSEQRIGLGLYQSMVGKLMNLPEGPVGEPFPAATFVAQETAMLRQQRVALLESQPSLADMARIGR